MIKNQKLLYKLPVEVARTDFLQNQNLDCLFTVKYINLNNIYFGNGYYGIQAASRGYFDTDVSFLSLSQMAYLCAIPNNPTMYNPYKNPDNTLGRRDRIKKHV